MENTDVHLCTFMKTQTTVVHEILLGDLQHIPWMEGSLIIISMMNRICYFSYNVMTVDGNRSVCGQGTSILIYKLNI